MSIVIISFLLLVILLYGRSLGRKNRFQHQLITGIAMGGDMLLLLYLTIFRDAISKIDSTIPTILIIHIVFALITVIGYVAAIYVGIMLGRGHSNYRSKMIRLDRIIIPCRILLSVTALLLRV